MLVIHEIFSKYIITLLCTATEMDLEQTITNAQKNLIICPQTRTLGTDGLNFCL